MNTNFMTGKKKITAALAPVLVAIAAIVTPQPEAQAELVAGLQGIAVLGSMILSAFFIREEKKLDEAREVTKQQEQITRQTEEEQATKRIEAQAKEIIIEEVTEAVPDFDMAAFMKKVDPMDNLNAINKFYEYRHEGRKTKCHHLEHALAYVDKYIELVQLALATILKYPVDEADKHLGDERGSCPYVTVESMARQQGWLTLLSSYRQAIRMMHFTERLKEQVDAGYITDWKYRLGPGATLHGVADTADDLIRTLNSEPRT